jgi:8-oxo-dGTP pyrophosphatase MutT (NUDIX family)
MTADPREGPAGFHQVGEEEIYRGHFITVAKGTFRAPDGSTFERDLVRHPGAVAVVPILDGDRLVLVRQYRAAIDEHVLELPAGIRDVEDEPTATTAERELLEETGYRAGRVEFLTRFANSVGFTDEEVEIFLARDLTLDRKSLQGIEEQHMTVEEVPLDDALGLIEEGRLRDAKTVVGVLLALRRLGR